VWIVASLVAMPQVLARHRQPPFRPCSYWALTASGVNLVGWNGALTEEQIELWESLAAQGIPVSRVTLAEHHKKVRKVMKAMKARKAMKLRKAMKVAQAICGPFAERHLKAMKGKKAKARTSAWHVD